MSNDVLLLSGFSFRQDNYRKLISSAPKDWTFHKINYFDILKHSSENNFHEVIYKYIEANKLDTVTLIAHSLGGAYAINFAYHYPARVKKMYLLNTVGIRHQALFLKFLMLVLLNKRQDFKKHIFDDLKGVVNVARKPLIHLKLLLYVKGVDLEYKATKLDVNTSIIWAEKDYLLPVSDGEKLHKLIKNSKFVRLRNIGHDWPVHAPELF